MFNVFAISIILCVHSLSTTEAIDFARFYTNKGVSQPLLPLPSKGAVKCLNSLRAELFVCRNQSLSHWNVTDYSTLADVCCAQWDTFDCDLDYVGKSKCTFEDMEEVNDYFEDLMDFYNTKTCKTTPRGSTQCFLPMVSSQAPQPPLPGPLVIDCLGNMPPAVRYGCAEVAMSKWNISRHHKVPIRSACCATWDDIDCLDEIAKLKCPGAEVRATEDFFRQVENWSQQVYCSSYAYHSNNCTLKSAPESGHQFIMVQNVEESYIDVVFPAKPDSPKSDAPFALKQMNDDYNDFLMNYILTVFPHLMNLLILLVMIMATVIIMQCFILARQVKQDRLIAAAANKRGYMPLNMSEMNKLNI